MSSDFRNVYDDGTRSESYASLEFPGTYWLAYRDLPGILREHVRGTAALDFGCGAGRSTRFLGGLGFTAVGVDISESMLDQARRRDPSGDYRPVPDGALAGLEDRSFDLILAAFTFDNIPTFERKRTLFDALRERLAPEGRIVTIVSDPEIYRHEWASFSTRDFPENAAARCGDRVKIVMLDVADRRPVEDILWTAEGYREVHDAAGLESIARFQPLGRPTEPYAWVSETRLAPWAIDVLAPRAR